jgi:hypothetical protein
MPFGNGHEARRNLSNGDFESYLDIPDLIIRMANYRTKNGEYGGSIRLVTLRELLYLFGMEFSAK